MTFDLDITIFVGFLLITLALGLASSRGVTNITEYAVGDRKFSTATIVSTIVATWISGIFFYTNISEAYSNGLYYILVSIFDPIVCFTLIAIFFAPRMKEFLGKLSIAEAMGELFGNKVRIITAIAGFIGTTGIIAIQLKLAGLIFEYALNIPVILGAALAAIIVTLYSSLGGIKSVTFTDIIQFFTFGVVIPIIAYVTLVSVDSLDIVVHTLTTNPLFDYKRVLDFSNPLSLNKFFLLIFFIVPGFTPVFFQRIAMAKNTTQVSKSFIIASLVCLVLSLILNWVAILILSINPHLKEDEIVKYVISQSSYAGLKGAALAGIMAMIMSTVDSWINSASILIVHDFCKPLKIKFIENELFSARVVSLFIGSTSLILSLREGTLLELLVIAYSLYMPTVTVPFIMAVLGFRSTGKSVICGMAAGFITVLVWDYVLQIKAANSIPAGMLANLLVLMGSHYLLGQKGGWVGIKDNSEVIRIRQQRKLKIRRFWINVRSFNIISVCRENCPKGEGLISILGFFIMISAFSSTNTLAKEYQLLYAGVISALYPIVLCSSAILISYPLWLESWKNTPLAGVFWNIIMFSVLICFSFLMVLISQFSEIQLMVFMINILVVSSLMRWKWALLNIFLGVGIVSLYYENYLATDVQEISFISSQFKIIYLLLLTSSSLVLFLKPKQEQHDLTRLRLEHFGDKLDDQRKELAKSHELKYEFLRNLEHEARTPITGIAGLGQVLWECYDKFPETRRKNIIQEIAQSSERLISFVNNLIDLSKLSSMNYELDIKEINLTNLVYEQAEHCRKLYVEEENRDLQQFVFMVEDNIIARADKYYITRTIDNIIINAIKYCKEGNITIKLGKDKEKGMIEFSVTDEGIGIPQDDLKDIFGAFVVSSRTRTPAGGRGVGLALAEKVIKLHKGKIRAESNGKKGATVTFNIPLG